MAEWVKRFLAPLIVSIAALCAFVSPLPAQASCHPDDSLLGRWVYADGTEAFSIIRYQTSATILMPDGTKIRYLGADSPYDPSGRNRQMTYSLAEDGKHGMGRQYIVILSFLRAEESTCFVKEATVKGHLIDKQRNISGPIEGAREFRILHFATQTSHVASKKLAQPGAEREAILNGGGKTPANPPDSPYVLRPAATRSVQLFVRGPDQQLAYNDQATKVVSGEYNRLCRGKISAALGPSLAGSGEIMARFFKEALVHGEAGLESEVAKYQGRSPAEQDMAKCLAEVSLGLAKQQIAPPEINQAAATTPNPDAARNGTVIAGNGQSAMHCAAIVTIANGDPKSVAGGGRVIQNNCGQTIEITWCYVDKECGVSSGAMWSVGAGKSWPVSAEREVRWAACLGANTVRFVDGTAGTRFICNAPRGGPQPKAQPGPPLKSGN